MNVFFDNQDRKRFYGFRVGDIIEYSTGLDKLVWIVIGYGSSDESIFAEKLSDGKKRHLHPELCALLLKVEKIREVIK